METVVEFIKAHALEDLLAWHHQLEASERFGLSIARMEQIILESGLLPARYQRNRQTISQPEQLKLFNSQVGVIGCGGLGCYVIEELSRLGVGRIVVIDPDTFEEHNLNRQLFSTPWKLGEAKVSAALRRIAEVNPAVTIIPFQEALSAANGAELLNGCRLAVDALDNIKVRLELAQVCNRLDIPLVHGAIAGWFGQVVTQYPGEDTLSKIYGAENAAKGIELSYGNPSFTPAVVAALEVAEACKLLLGKGKTLQGRQLLLDLLSMEISEIALA